MKKNIGNLLAVSIGLVVGSAVPLSETTFGVCATPAERVVPFCLTPLSPFNKHLPMNALEAGLKCPNRPESDLVSVVEMLASGVNFFNRWYGGITRIGSLFLAAVRQGVYLRSPALSTRHLDTRDAALGERIVLTGAGRPVRQMILRPRGSAQ